MRVVVQRAASAQVETGGEVVARIGGGLLVLAGFEADDAAPGGADDIAWMAGKIARLRVFSDAAGVMNRSVREAGGEVLAVSQFTLFAATRKGSRPSWSRAAPPDVAAPLFARFVAQLEREVGRPVPSGVFGADMRVHLVNDGPVTLIIDSRAAE